VSHIAILNSESLIGKELKQALSGRPELWEEVRLLATGADAIGVVTEGVDGAAFVQELSEESLQGVDIVIACSGPQPADGSWLPNGATLVQLSPAPSLIDAVIVVAGVNLERVRHGMALVSPHPSVVALGLLLDPLRRYGLEMAACWVLQPASTRGEEGVDELMEQTRAILSFQPDQPQKVFGHQLAFNILPSDVQGSELAAQLAQVLDNEVTPSLQILQAGVFHGIAAGAHIRLSNAPEPRELVDELVAGPFFESLDEHEAVGPVAAAGRSSLLLGSVESSVGLPGAMTVWLAADNLTVLGAHNVVSIIEALAAPRH
jgi:aspartate-semialdehyde dehydrogenase